MGSISQLSHTLLRSTAAAHVFLAADTAERKGKNESKARIRQKPTKNRSATKTDLEGVELAKNVLKVCKTS